MQRRAVTGALKLVPTASCFAFNNIWHRDQLWLIAANSALIVYLVYFFVLCEAIKIKLGVQMFLLITWRNIYTQMSPKKDREFRRSVRLLAAEAGQLTQYAFLPFSRFCHFSNMPTAQQVSANLGLLHSFCPSDVCNAKQRMWYNKIDSPAWSLLNVVVDYYRTLPAPRPFCNNCFRHIWYLPLFVKIWQKM